MFLDVWKEKRIKRNLDRAIENYSGATPTSALNRVGLLIDSTSLIDADELAAKLGMFRKRMNITKLCYVEQVAGNNFQTNSVFDESALNWKGDFNSAEVDFFLNQHYDMLISYYTTPRLILRYITAMARAHFKVGLTIGNDYRMNDLSIATHPQEIDLFCDELKNYLKILKRIE